MSPNDGFLWHVAQALQSNTSSSIATVNATYDNTMMDGMILSPSFQVPVGTANSVYQVLFPVQFVHSDGSHLPQFSSDVELLVDEVVAREPLVTERREQVHRLITSADGV